MKEIIYLDLIYHLFQLIKQFPRPKLKQRSIDGLTQSEHELLMTLAINLNQDKKAITVTEISNLLQITPAGVTHLINSLEEAGCVERLPAPNDRRIVLIKPTDKGRQATEAFLSEIQEQMIGLVNHLGEEDSKTLFHLISKSLKYFAAQSGS